MSEVPHRAGVGSSPCSHGSPNWRPAGQSALTNISWPRGAKRGNPDITLHHIGDPHALRFIGFTGSREAKPSLTCRLIPPGTTPGRTPPTGSGTYITIRDTTAPGGDQGRRHNGGTDPARLLRKAALVMQKPHHFITRRNHDFISGWPLPGISFTLLKHVARFYPGSPAKRLPTPGINRAVRRGARPRSWHSDGSSRHWVLLPITG